MLYQKFIRLVEEHADDLIQKWIIEVRTNPSTHGYKDLPEEVLRDRVFDVYKKLGNWILDEDPNYRATANHFMKLGVERTEEGINVSEIIYAIILARVVLWKYVMDKVIITGALDLQHALDFYHKVNNFFDKAIYFIAAGVEKNKETNITPAEKEDHIEKSVNAITKWFIKEPI